MKFVKMINYRSKSRFGLVNFLLLIVRQINSSLMSNFGHWYYSQILKYDHHFFHILSNLDEFLRWIKSSGFLAPSLFILISLDHFPVDFWKLLGVITHLLDIFTMPPVLCYRRERIELFAISLSGIHGLDNIISPLKGSCNFLSHLFVHLIMKRIHHGCIWEREENIA